MRPGFNARETAALASHAKISGGPGISREVEASVCGRGQQNGAENAACSSVAKGRVGAPFGSETLVYGRS